MMRAHHVIMRTTLDIDTPVLEAVRQWAAHRGQSLGAAVSELILRGLQAETAVAKRSGFPVFPPGPRPITLEDVRQAEDED
jgi:hypothetical protein